jgi:hypothetical protein
MTNSIKNRLKIIYNHLIIFKYNSFSRPKQVKNFVRNLTNNLPSVDYLTIHSTQERSVVIEEEDRLLTEVLFSCYFIKKENPQTGEVLGKADFEYIRKWYESVLKAGIHAIIIHDGIDDDFIFQYTTNKIKFRRFFPGNHPLIDERWITFYIFLKATKIQKAFFTDIGDVIVTKNPFVLINEKHQLFIGRDNANKIRLSGWILNEVEKFKLETGEEPPKSFYYQALYNVGIVGGNRKICLFILSKVIDYILKSSPRTFKEMTIFNVVIHKYFFPKLSYHPEEKVMVNLKNDPHASHKHLVSGYPLNSMFKGYEYDSEAYFIHK